MKVLAVDYGSKRIGLALGDARLGIASPLKGVENRGDKTLQFIASKAEELGACAVLIGLPLTPLGKEGRRAREVREFSERLKALLPEGVEVILWDERYTTREAYEMMKGLSPNKKKRLKDSLSAYAILLEYMESL